MSSVITIIDRINTTADRIDSASDIIHAVANRPADGADVQTEGGTIKPVAKAVAEIVNEVRTEVESQVSELVDDTVTEIVAELSPLRFSISDQSEGQILFCNEHLRWANGSMTILTDGGNF